MLPDFTLGEWLLAMVAACGIGVSKSGLPGISLLHVVIFAQLFSARGSTGVVLPMLICGDIGAVLLFRRHALWSHVLKTLPPAVLGVGIGWWLMRWLPEGRYRPLIGGVVLVLALLQLLRNWRPGPFTHVPHTHAFAWGMGLTAGVTTMLANAAGPVMGLYLLAVSLPKAEFVGTSAWFFLLINLIKVPFSAQLGLISTRTLAFNALLLPCIAAGLFAGRSLVARIPQKWFDSLVLAFAMIASMKLLGVF
ncbi:MAG TPA: sulfite exporter TauE/SafE family protein [Verrucomicrobiales bacterium]|nr:sulfite exporter TauE/SafE family protein [Verrucomicrobiales bacterium]